MSAVKKTVVVDVTSDVACPWCWVGKRSIETAAANLCARGKPIDLQLHWHPFQLAPHIPIGTTVSLLDHLAKLVGSRRVVDEWVANPATMPCNVQCSASRLPDIYFRLLPDAPGFNTYPAHMLLTYAGAIIENYAAQNALKESLLRRTHGEGRNMGDVKELTEAAREAGLAQTQEDVEKILSDTNVKRVLDRELRESRELRGFSGVPFFVFPNGQIISGGQPVDVFESELLKLL